MYGLKSNPINGNYIIYHTDDNSHICHVNKQDYDTDEEAKERALWILNTLNKIN